MARLDTISHKGPAVCGVYAIKRVGTADCYVGQSINVVARLYDHRKELRRGTHRAERLQAAYLEAGEAAFETEILADGMSPADREMLALVEQEFMDVLDASYNTCPSSVSRAGAKMSARGRANCKVGQAKRWANPGERIAASAAQKKRFEDPEERQRTAHNRGRRLWPDGRVFSKEALANLKASGARRKGQTSPNKGKALGAHESAHKAKISAGLKSSYATQTDEQKRARVAKANAARRKQRS